MGIWGVFRIENPSKTRDLEGFLCFESTGFKNFSPAALLEPLKYSNLVKARRRRKNFWPPADVWIKPPPLVFPRSGTRGGFNPRIWVDGAEKCKNILELGAGTCVVGIKTLFVGVRHSILHFHFAVS